MPSIARVLRSLLWLSWMCLLPGLTAVRVAYAGDHVVVADFDGDGRHDRAFLDRHDRSTFRVWLSTTQHVSVVRGSTPITRIAARDLDGDGRHELIGRTSAGLQVWTRRHSGFAPYRARRELPDSFAPPAHRNLDHRQSDRPLAIASLEFSPAVVPTARSRAPAPLVIRAASRTTSEPRSPSVLAPFSPRPPPISR